MRASNTNGSPEALPPFLEDRRTALPRDLGWRGGDVGRWRRRLLNAWRATLPPAGVAAAATAGEAVRLTHATGAVAEGRLSFPPGEGPHPAVILFHEHGGHFATGWEKLHQCPGSAATRRAFYGDVSVAEKFRAAGLATLACDAPCFGRRQAGGHAGQQALAASATAMGWSLAGLAASEAVGLAEWLEADPRVGPIGAFGFSMGGHTAWVAAALSPRIRAVASVGWLARRADLMASGGPLLRGHSAWHFVHPGLSHRADLPDLAGLAADRPLFFRSGRGDPHMPEASVAAAWAHVARIARASEGPRPDAAFHEAGHTCPPAVVEAAAAFLGDRLSR